MKITNMREKMVFRCAILLFLMIGIESEAQLFSLMPKEKTGIDFNNIIVESKSMNIFTYEYLFNGGGVAIGDINNDGWNDVFFTGNMVKNKLYLNKGNFRFEDISSKANIDKGEDINTGVSMMDVNGDGWLDIYVCKSGLSDPKLRVHNLYINNHDLTFTDKSAEMGLADSSYSTQAYFYDFDKDGDLDLYLLNHPGVIGESKKIILTYNEKGELEARKPDKYDYETDRYLENQNGKFVDKTIASGILNHAFGLSASIGDFNHDGYADIYVANDYTRPDFLYINNRNGTFTEKADSFFSHYSYNSMGSDFADINNDGLEDLLVLDMLPDDNYRQKQFRQQMSYDQYNKLIMFGFKPQFVKNVLQLGVPNKKYTDISHALGIANSDWSWAPLIADFDNNGHKDIYITNGYYHDFTDQDFAKYKMDSLVKILSTKAISQEKLKELLYMIPSVMVKNYFYANEGKLKWTKNPLHSGLDIPSFSNGAAYGDLDNDGDLEIVVNNINQEAFVFKNNLIENKGGNYIRLRLTSKKSPNRIYGAGITVTTKDTISQFYRYYPVRGYISSHEHVIHIGIGKNTEAIIAIALEGGPVFQTFQKQANQTYEINIDELKPLPTAIHNNDKQPYSFEDITLRTKIHHLVKENEYIDTKQEPLIPKKYSRSGPAMAVGDMDGDTLDDIFIGGAKDYEAGIYLQNNQGEFIKKMNPVFSNDKIYEDVAAKFLDFDRDGDQDLLVTTGGNDYGYDMKKYPVRLYVNNGYAEFTRAGSSVFPYLYTSSKTIAVEDYNRDGYDDVFIAGQIVPGHYGLRPSSYLLKNMKGRFQIDDFSKQHERLAMINDAKWVDIDRDSFKDLVIVGEWISPHVFRNKNGSLENRDETIGNFRGWWTAIQVADLNNDNLQDLILGNYGVNSRYIGTSNQPMSMLVNDFDKNGSTDVVISTFNNGLSHPVAIRDNLLDQMPFLKKRFNRYEKYSKATTSDLFLNTELVGADTLFANYMNSIVLYAKKNGGYDMKKLPMEAQFFPVNAIIPLDINRDGNLDLLLGGNDYHIDIESGRLDAGQGLILENVGGQQYKEKNWGISYPHNLDLSGDVKTIIPIRIGDKQAYIIGRNNEPIQVIYLKEKIK